MEGTNIRLDLIDECQVWVWHVLLGAGHLVFPTEGRYVELELLETRTFTRGVVFTCHGAVR